MFKTTESAGNAERKSEGDEMGNICVDDVRVLASDRSIFTSRAVFNHRSRIGGNF